MKRFQSTISWEKHFMAKREKDRKRKRREKEHYEKGNRAKRTMANREKGKTLKRAKR